ncbi:hypothetical protein ACLB2K_021308 [Fragaria x ananassa]
MESRHSLMAPVSAAYKHVFFPYHGSTIPISAQFAMVCHSYDGSSEILISGHDETLTDCRHISILSWKGPDTCKGIVVNIDERLKRSGIKTFMDEEGLQVGDVITPALLVAIKESRFASVVSLTKYASSTWCLEELRQICLSMENNRILPLFYQVDPTVFDIRRGVSKKAFSKHETYE